MIKMSVMYPNEKGKRFDADYFAHKHVALVHKKLGPAVLVKSEVDKSVDANSPFIAIVHLYFKTMDDYLNGFFPHAAELTADMVNYTDIIPQVQISEIVK